VIRTVLGDIAPSSLGFCHAHEHVLIRASIGTRENPDLLIDDVAAATEEVELFREAGGAALVDAMPLDCGRDPVGLVEVSRRSGVHIVATTGFHTRRYYEPGHWSEDLPVDEIVELLVGEILFGMDRHSHGGPYPERISACAGVMKIGTDESGVDARARRLMEALAEAHGRTGAPILTHTERGRHGLSQVEHLASLGIDPSVVLVSHVDRNLDKKEHRDLAQTGAFLVFDGLSRTKYHSISEVIELIELVVSHGGEDRVLLGMDLALRSHRVSTGGKPGLAFVLERFLPELRAAGFSDEHVRKFGWVNPAKALDFTVGSTPAEDSRTA
jgi:predicted metal-dependent phosphotriesterase family hydrolase